MVLRKQGLVEVRGVSTVSRTPKSNEPRAPHTRRGRPRTRGVRAVHPIRFRGRCIPVLAFKELQEGLGLGKSALFYLLVALSAAGLVVKPEGKGKPYALNTAFSEELAAFAEWWRAWLRL
jgi:hypothetical protein